jgi:hypothetical protein
MGYLSGQVDATHGKVQYGQVRLYFPNATYELSLTQFVSSLNNLPSTLEALMAGMWLR